MTYIQQYPAETLILVYLVITFSYSFLEKLFDWKNSLVYYRDHFKDTILESSIPVLLVIVIIMEILSVLLSISGIYNLLLYGNHYYAITGLILIAVTLIGLMAGQRIAKDYPGAMNITVYFIVTVIGILLLE